MNIRKIKTAAALLVLAGTLAIGCNTADHKQPTTSADSTTSSPTGTNAEKTAQETPLKGCYVLVLKKDSLQLAVTAVNGKAVEGSMTLNFAEKDRSNGTFKGEYDKGILIGIYTFNSEGTSSQRQVIFKKVEEGFVEGYGKMKTVDGKEMFANQNEVEFDQANVFKYTENCLN
jgi:hypothetical protein